MSRDRTPGQRALRDLYFDQQQTYFQQQAENSDDAAKRQQALQQVAAVQADREAAQAAPEPEIEP